MYKMTYKILSIVHRERGEIVEGLITEVTVTEAKVKVKGHLI